MDVVTVGVGVDGNSGSSSMESPSTSSDDLRIRYQSFDEEA